MFAVAEAKTKLYKTKVVGKLNWLKKTMESNGESINSFGHNLSEPHHTTLVILVD